VGLAGALLAATLGAALLRDGGVTAQGSALSRDASGWLAARRYLEQRGARVRLLDAPFEADALLDPTGGRAGAQGPIPLLDDHSRVLVLVFPWQRFAARDVRAGVQRHLRAGGTLVVAYTGEPLSWGEGETFSALGLGWRDARGEPPLHPLRWREFMAREWLLRRESAAGPESAVRLRPPRRAPRAPASAQVWYRDPGGEPAVFAYPRSGGRVVVLPASALSNARLGHAGNADLLASLLASLPGEWLLDEYHHGLSPAVAAQDARLQLSLELYLAHVVLVYMLALLALTRRFGPAWSEAPPVGGSAGTFLLGLGALHHRLGHHAAAARRLIERAAELQPRLQLPDTPAAQVSDGAGLLALARLVGRAQRARGAA
jgi:hypothetical protein